MPLRFIGCLAFARGDLNALGFELIADTGLREGDEKEGKPPFSVGARRKPA